MQSIRWSQRMIYDYELLIDAESLKDELRDSVDVFKDELNDNVDVFKDELLKINKGYPLIKQLGGVTIEVGSITVVPTSIENILELLNTFLTITNNTKEPFDVNQDIEALIRWAHLNEVEIPNPKYCEGYIYNNELVNLDFSKGSAVLQFKYKDSLENSFIVYRLSFIQERDSFFILKRQVF